MDYLVIPAYEPDYNLIRLIKKVREKSDFEVIVINDGSSASCNRVFEQAATYATILHHSLNQGKGQALKTAFRYISLKVTTMSLSQQMQMGSISSGTSCVLPMPPMSNIRN